MSSDKSKESFPDTDQRVAFCHTQWKTASSRKNQILDSLSEQFKPSEEPIVEPPAEEEATTDEQE
jgi:hypothetical protein